VRAGLSRPLRAYPWLCALVPTCDRTPCHARVVPLMRRRLVCPWPSSGWLCSSGPRSCRIGRFSRLFACSPGAAPLPCRPTDAGGTPHPWQRHSTTPPTSRVSHGRPPSDIGVVDPIVFRRVPEGQ